jgi:hypothetical protein
MLAAKALFDKPVLFLIDNPFTDGTSPRRLLAVGLPKSEKVTVTFSSLLGFLWCLIAA